MIFWRWPQGKQRQSARDGMKAWILKDLPKYRRAAPRPKPDTLALLLPKMRKILNRGYVTVSENPGSVRSKIDYFHVPKGYITVPADEEAKARGDHEPTTKIADIRVVYNGTSCGLNDAVWAPNFWLATPKSAARVLNYNYCGVDIDFGDFFLNFPLPEVFRKYSGVDMRHFKSGLGCGDVADESFNVRW